MMKRFKDYIIIYFANLVFFYGILMVSIIHINNLNEYTYEYTLISIAGMYTHIKYSLEMRQNGKLKNIFFSILVLISVFVMCVYYFAKYKISFVTADFLIVENFTSYILLPLFIYNEYIFYVYPLEKLEKIYKKYVF